jgi:RNA polymerase sigma-70 factor (ECF subfamily)
LVRPYERAIYFAAKSVLESEADAEEAAQEAVLKAFTHIGNFRAESKFSTWLIQITINEARMKLRKNHAHLYESPDEQTTDEQGDFRVSLGDPADQLGLRPGAKLRSRHN